MVLFNLGGPDRLEAVRPFLFNLFNDPAIIALPQPLRWVLARLISGRRAPLARSIYAKIGNGSPLLPNTLAQAAALEKVLGKNYRCFVAMRYWHPRAAATAAEVARWQPDRVLLLPLYPQYSTTTTASSLEDWRRAAHRANLRAPESAICCYPAERGFVAALADLTRRTIGQVPNGTPYRLLFSAHGLPKKVVAAGDPYQWQIERTAAAILQELDIEGLDSVVCYQSRVGPLEWLGPATDAEIRRAAAEGKAIVVAPIAFVSEHSETLVELDIEYRHLAEASGAPGYWRVPTVGAHPSFIAGLAALVRAAPQQGIVPGTGARLCPAECVRCALAAAPSRKAA